MSILLILALIAVVLFVAFRVYWDVRQTAKSGNEVIPKPNNTGPVKGLDKLGTDKQPLPAPQVDTSQNGDKKISEQQQKQNWKDLKGVVKDLKGVVNSVGRYFTKDGGPVWQ